MTAKGQIAAFFDFDKTLLEVESGKLGLTWLRDNKLLSPGYILKVLAANMFYQRRLLSEERMVRILLTFYKNKRLADFQKGAEDFYRKYLKQHLAPNLLRRLNFHKSEGHLVILISGSLRYLLEPVAGDLGFHHLLCTDLEVGLDGRLTGRPAGSICVDKNKKRMALELAATVALNFPKSYAYGNHQNDIPLLELVGHPYAVEPTPSLAKVARQRSWPRLSFR